VPETARRERLTRNQQKFNVKLMSENYSLLISIFFSMDNRTGVEKNFAPFLKSTIEMDRKYPLL
jgi:hypothetical protein